jgi:hypothetical protein
LEQDCLQDKPYGPEQAEGQIQPAKNLSEVGSKLHQLEKLDRVDNIWATFVAESRFHGKDKGHRENRFYFRISNSEYRQKTGMAIEEGATYKMRGEIEGVGRFEKKLSEERCSWTKHANLRSPRTQR